MALIFLDYKKACLRRHVVPLRRRIPPNVGELGGHLLTLFLVTKIAELYPLVPSRFAFLRTSPLCGKVRVAVETV
jgi:hypothetical protein